MAKRKRNYRKFIDKTRFSLELEAEFPQYVDIMELRKRYRKLLKSWTVTTERSLLNGLEFKPADTNKLYFRPACFEEISEVMYIIRKHGGIIDGPKSGLHIHFDATRMSNEEIIRIVDETVFRQSYLINHFNVSPERMKKYCKRIENSDLNGLTPNILTKFRDKSNKRSFNVPILKSKYYLLSIFSLKEFNSIEFRMMNGVKYLRDIKAHVKYLQEFLINCLERR